MAASEPSRKRSNKRGRAKGLPHTQKPNLKTLQEELHKALALINDYNLTSQSAEKQSTEIVGLNNTQSLLDRCAAVVDESEEDTRPTLRVIHHFACSGGTLISKCLAAQPNVFLLSELHPTTRHGNDWSKAVYTPRDIITQAIYSGMPNVEPLAEELFASNILRTDQHTKSFGGYLVIRAHSHADYCIGTSLPDIDTVTRVLRPFFNIRQLVTVRNPIDSFLSLRQNRWVHFKPDTFDEYCRRLLKFLCGFDRTEIVKYEDFVACPQDLLKKCADILDLPTSENALNTIDLFKVSGDSGRAGSEISVRQRKDISEDYASEIKSSEQFKTFCKHYHFPPLA